MSRSGHEVTQTHLPSFNTLSQASPEALSVIVLAGMPVLEETNLSVSTN